VTPRWCAFLAAVAASWFLLLAQRGCYADADQGWLGLGVGFALGCLAGRRRLPSRGLWGASCLALALSVLPLPLPPWLAAAAPLVAAAGAGAWCTDPLGRGQFGPTALGVTLAVGAAAGLRWGLAAVGWIVYADLPWVLVALAGVAALGLALPPGEAPPRGEAPDAHGVGLAALASLRCGVLAALVTGHAAALGASSPWAWCSLGLAAALAAGVATRAWSPRPRLGAEALGWCALALPVALGPALPAVVVATLAGGATAAVAARPALERSWRPLLALFAGALLGAGLSPALYTHTAPATRARLALGSPDDAALAEGVAAGMVRERFAAGGYGGAQVVDVGGDEPLRLLTAGGRVREALPQRRDALPELLRSQAMAAALAAWLAPGERVLLAGVGSGYTHRLLSETPGVELTAVEQTPGVAATWTEPGDPWGLFNGRLGGDAERLARITRGPLHPHLLHGRYAAVLLPTTPAPSTLGAARRHPLVVGPLTLAAGLAELEAWARAESLLVFRAPGSEARIALAGLERVSWPRLRAGWERGGALPRELTRLGIGSPEQLLACLEGGSEAVRLALESPDPSGTLSRVGAERGPALVAEADADVLVAVTEALAAANHPATPLWARAAVETERSAPALATLGALLLNTGQPDAGRELLHEALEVNPQHAPARLQLAFDLQRQQRTADAESLLRAGLRPGTRQPALHYALGKLAEARGDSKAALTAYEAAGETADARERAHELRSALQREHALATRVKAAYELLRAAEAGEADPQQGLALALELIEAELEREDRLLLARTLDGFAALEGEPLLRANLQRHRARVLQPLAKDPRLGIRAAEAWLAGERPGEALAVLEPLCAGPAADRPRALRLLGDAHALRGDADLARSAYRKALALGPSLTSNGRTYEQLGRLEAREGDLDLGLRLLDEGDAALGGVPRLRQAKAEVLEAVGHDEQARAAWEAYLEVAPPGPERRAVEARLGK